ncbi:transmembrane protein 110, like isoform X1 [Corythoichthys intestinalis]|uniref:transmembrane protein 110, like isoform X1 n=1 Tax=Corythoichthys intestinalis TaxID=161448 RepID=UPI0025A4E09A|nr:transmembrane protein 110, like isoform X1 [Corythoichthys intestinalis]
MKMYGYGGPFLSLKRLSDAVDLAVSNMSDVHKADPHGCDDGALTDRFGVLIQGLLAIVAFSTLMLKRFREPAGIRRPWRIWSETLIFFTLEHKNANMTHFVCKFPYGIFCRFYDTSKQAIGALFIHFANVLLSTLTKEDPCSLSVALFLYTSGEIINQFVLICVISQLPDELPPGRHGGHAGYLAGRQSDLQSGGAQAVDIAHVWGVRRSPASGGMARSVWHVPAHHGSGERRHQSGAARAGMVQSTLVPIRRRQKPAVVVHGIRCPSQLQEVLLSYIANPQLELVLVMLIVPFIVNSIMFWVVDSLTMRKLKSTKSLDDSCEVSPEKADTSPWAGDDESRVLLTVETDTEEDEEPPEDAALPPARYSGAPVRPGWVAV